MDGFAGILDNRLPASMSAVHMARELTAARAQVAQAREETEEALQRSELFRDLFVQRHLELLALADTHAKGLVRLDAQRLEIDSLSAAFAQRGRRLDELGAAVAAQTDRCSSVSRATGAECAAMATKLARSDSALFAAKTQLAMQADQARAWSAAAASGAVERRELHCALDRANADRLKAQGQASRPSPVHVRCDMYAEWSIGRPGNGAIPRLAPRPKQARVAP